MIFLDINLWLVDHVCMSEGGGKVIKNKARFQPIGQSKAKKVKSRKGKKKFSEHCSQCQNVKSGFVNF